MNEERNCGTCQHWILIDAPWEAGLDHGLCKGMDGDEGAPAFISGPDLYGVELRTLTSFSCSLWEAKP